MPLVLDEIHNYGRKGRIFMVHLRNPHLPQASGFSTNAPASLNACTAESRSASGSVTG